MHGTGPGWPGHPWRPGELAAHLLELVARRHLLGEQRGLDAVEQALEPADELGLGDAQLGVAGRGGLAERDGHPLQLGAQVGRERGSHLLHRAVVDLLEPLAGRAVEVGLAHLVEQLLDHGADPHDLGRLLHRLAPLLASASARPRSPP
jgi:hypothetical protein